MNGFKYRTIVLYLIGKVGIFASLVTGCYFDGIWTGEYSRSVGTPSMYVSLALTHLLSLSSYCELIIDGKDVNEQIIKHSQIAYGSGIVFEMW